MRRRQAVEPVLLLCQRQPAGLHQLVALVGRLVLGPLGLVRLVTRPATIGFGKTYSEFWINLRASMSDVDEGSGVHIALRAKSTGDVDAFHAAALATGGRCDGPPGNRPHDRVKYY